MSIKSRTDSTSEINANIETNTTRSVSQADIRQRLLDIVDSAFGVVPFVTKTANYTATEDDEVISVDSTAGSVTITLPACATTRVGKVYTLIKIVAANSMIADGNAAETINGAATKTVTTQWNGLLLINTGTAWLAQAITGA